MKQFYAEISLAYDHKSSIASHSGQHFIAGKAKQSAFSLIAESAQIFLYAVSKVFSISSIFYNNKTTIDINARQFVGFHFLFHLVLVQIPGIFSQLRQHFCRFNSSRSGVLDATPLTQQTSLFFQDAGLFIQRNFKQFYKYILVIHNKTLLLFVKARQFIYLQFLFSLTLVYVPGLFLHLKRHLQRFNASLPKVLASFDLLGRIIFPVEASNFLFQRNTKQFRTKISIAARNKISIQNQARESKFYLLEFLLKLSHIPCLFSQLKRHIYRFKSSRSGVPLSSTLTLIFLLLAGTSDFLFQHKITQTNTKKSKFCVKKISQQFKAWAFSFFLFHFLLNLVGNPGLFYSFNTNYMR